MSELQGSLNIVSEYKINLQNLEDVGQHVGHFAYLHVSHHVQLYILVKKSHKRETVFVDLSIIARAPPPYKEISEIGKAKRVELYQTWWKGREGYVSWTDSIRFLAAVSDRTYRVASVRDALDFGPPADTTATIS